MWILKWLPDWLFYAMLFAGVVGMLASWAFSFIPLIKQYNLPIKVVSIFLVVIGTYMAGAINNENSWLLRVKEMEAKVAQAEAQSAQENVKIVEKIVTKTQIVKERGQDIIRYVDREVVKYDTKFAPGGQCELPKEFIKAMNDAAEAPIK
jgi:hypothetical protein